MITIGDVSICPAQSDNPYTEDSGDLFGEARAHALRQFRDGQLPDTLTAWYAPCAGGARKLTDPSEVDWRGLR